MSFALSLILDDSTSSVDTETEASIRDALDELMENRTTFIIAHRVSTVKNADVVIVLEKGEITQIGTHEQLMAEDGHYRDIAAVQLYGDTLAFDTEGEIASQMARANDTLRVVAAAAAKFEEASDGAFSPQSHGEE